MVRPAATRPSNQPSRQPIQQPKAIDFPIIPRGFNQMLPTSSFSRQEAREGRMKSHLYLILQIEVSMWQQCEHVSQVSGKLIPQVNFNQTLNR